MRAPGGPLNPTAVHDVLEHRIKRSGLELPQRGSHVLRHSFALNLLRQGTGMKTIGDALGHRDIQSTFVYLRLDVDDLREVALPAPVPIPASPALPLASTCVQPSSDTGITCPSTLAEVLSKLICSLLATVP
jgi:hypothetical protein